MKKLVLLAASLLGYAALSCQSIYYLAYAELRAIDLPSCKDSLIFPINLKNFDPPNDLALCPDGNFYVTTSMVLNGTDPFVIARINFADSSLVLVDSLPIGGNSLVCTSSGVLLIGGYNMQTLDLNTMQKKVYSNLGPSISLAGDLTTWNGHLFGGEASGNILDIDIADSTKTEVFLDVSQTLWPDRALFGMATIAPSCDSSKIIFFASNANTYTEIYSINPLNKALTFVCPINHGVLGATSAAEFADLDCSVRLDFDKDDSSGKTGKDFQLLKRCGLPQNIVDIGDIEFYSGLKVDSMTFDLSPKSTGAFLTGVPNIGVDVSANGQGGLTLKNKPNASIASANMDFEQAINAIQLAGIAPSNGQLFSVEAVLHLRYGQKDTAFSFIETLPVKRAGRDTLGILCSDNQSFDLSTLLDPMASSGGKWSPSGSFLGGQLGAHPFSYIVDNSPCPNDTAIVTLNVLNIPVFSLGNDTVVCKNQGFPITLAAPSPSTWQDGTVGSNYFATGPGLFWAQATNSPACIFRDSILIDEKIGILVVDTFKLCYNEPFLWHNKVYQIDTTLCETSPSSNDCDSIHCYKLLFSQQLMTHFDTTICQGESIVWNGSSLNAAGFYRDTLTTSNGCDSISSIELKTRPLPNATILGDSSICSGQSGVLFTAISAKTSWSTGETTPEINVNQAGTYSAMVQDQFGCTAFDSIVVTANEAVFGEWALRPPVCSGQMDGSILLDSIIGGIGPFLFSLDSQPFVPANKFSNLSAGKYKLTIKDAEGCLDEQILTIQEPLAWDVELGPDTIINLGNTYPIPTQASVGNLLFDWGTNGALSCSDCPNPTASPSETTLFRLVAKDEMGCTMTDSILITVQKTGPGNDIVYFAPTVFSPNGDGFNDLFEIYGAQLEPVRLQVFSRWGEQLYTSDAPVFQWDGMFRGRPLSPGVYVWKIEYIDLRNNKKKVKWGDVTIAR